MSLIGVHREKCAWKYDANMYIQGIWNDEKSTNPEKKGERINEIKNGIDGAGTQPFSET